MLALLLPDTQVVSRLLLCQVSPPLGLLLPCLSPAAKAIGSVTATARSSHALAATSISELPGRRTGTPPCPHCSPGLDHPLAPSAQSLEQRMLIQVSPSWKGRHGGWVKHQGLGKWKRDDVSTPFSLKRCTVSRYVAQADPPQYHGSPRLLNSD